MKRIFSFLNIAKANRSKLMVCLALQFLFSLISLALPEVLRISTDAIENKNMDILKFCFILAAVSTVLFLILDAVLKVFTKELKNSYEEFVQVELLEKFISMKKLKLLSYKAGDIITNVINNATDSVGSSLACIFNTFDGTAVILISIVYMGIIQWKITLVIVLYNVVMRAVLVTLEKRLKENTKKSIAITKSNNTFLIDILTNMMIVKVFNKIDYFSKILLDKETETLKINTKMTAWRNGLNDGMWASVKLSEYFLLYGFGGYLVYKGEAGVGTLLGFTFAVDMFSKGINSLTYGIADKNTALANIEHIEQILSVSEIENEPCREIAEDNFVISFENVSFGFSDENILENVNFTIHKNEKIMIKGENGGGKSTLLNLIARLYRPSRGKVLYGKYDVNLINLDDLSKKYSYISQNSNILEGNVFQNISLALAYDTEKCNEILKKLNMAKIVDTPPKALSQGEKQRLNIGRSLYKPGGVVIILGDEIFSNIDKENAKNIAGLLYEEFKEKTVIMICHEAMDFKFDRIFEVKDKNVVIKDAGGVIL